MDIRDRIKKFFSKDSDMPVIETSQRFPVPAGFIDNHNTVFATPLKQGDKDCGARIYTYVENGISLQKEVVSEMDLQQWQDFQQRLEEAKEKGYMESGKVSIPSSLSEGRRGVYAAKVKRLVEGAFVCDGVNIYQTDENLRNTFIRSMSEKTWGNFSKVIDKVQKEEEAIRRNGVVKFENFTGK